MTHDRAGFGRMHRLVRCEAADSHFVSVGRVRVVCDGVVQRSPWDPSEIFAPWRDVQSG